VAEIPPTDAERTRQQGERIKALRDVTRVTKGRVMDALGLTTTNGYDLYERGTSVVRFNQVPEWAGAFNITPLAFSAVVLGLMDPADAIGSIIREKLHGRVPESEIEKLIDAHGDAPAEDQIAIANDALQAKQDLIEQSQSKKRSRSA